MDAFGAHSAKLGVSALLGPADPTTTDVRTVSPFSAPWPRDVFGPTVLVV